MDHRVGGDRSSRGSRSGPPRRNFDRDGAGPPSGHAKGTTFYRSNRGVGRGPPSRQAQAQKRERLVSEGPDDGSTCVVCCHGITIYSVGSCNHPVCHICSTRMRMLCRQNECPICRLGLEKVFFVREPVAFETLQSSSEEQKFPEDVLHGIVYTDEGIQQEVRRLLQHVCRRCDTSQTFSDFQSFREHIRKKHELYYCDLCVDNLKIFTHERKAYSRKDLATHRREGDRDDTSHRGHPRCVFCDTRFMDNDDLFRHLRRDHYFCHFCEADGSNCFYSDYNELRAHFRSDHFLCEEGDCVNERFTSAFRSEIDLKAHFARAHTAGNLRKSDARQARTVELQFSVRQRPAFRERIERRDRREQQDSRPNDVPNGHASSEPVPEMTPALGSHQEFPSLGQAPQPNQTLADNTSSPPEGTGPTPAANLVHTCYATRSTGGSSFAAEDFPALGRSGAVSSPGDRSWSVRIDHSGGPPAASNTDEVSISVSQRTRPFTTSSTASSGQQKQPPTPPRVTSISSSQNIRFQTGAAAEDFPSLPSDAPVSAPTTTVGGWGEPKKGKMKKEREVKRAGGGTKGRLPLNEADFPALGGGGPALSTGWVTQSDKKTVTTTRSSSVMTSSTSTGAGPRSLKDVSKASFAPPPASGGGKPRISNVTKSDNIRFDDDPEETREREVTLASWEGSRLGSAPPPSTSSTVGSKIALLKEKPGEAPPREKPVMEKPPQLSDAADFPSLGAPGKLLPSQKAAAVTAAAETAPWGVGGKAKKATPPGFTLPVAPKNKAREWGSDSMPSPTEMTFTSSSGRNFDLTPPSDIDVLSQFPPMPGPPQVTSAAAVPAPPPGIVHRAANAVYRHPEEFRDRNEALITKISHSMGDNAVLFESFKAASKGFQGGQLSPQEYFKMCLDFFQEKTFGELFPEFIALLPDISKQQALYKLFISSNAARKNQKKAGWGEMEVCSVCSQVLRRTDVADHMTYHAIQGTQDSQEDAFPALS
ncbi:unnamed protein product [Cyprideis torosa]|uniref:RING-type E3 ubiquitin transferase n=1 Tax=Cyprideis torosa TaxID=163714 RepID=A0A7R8WG67_9CRUS|nr:unnamed protein product [Cyprideis torosa]CAG0897715.1 unnamed protein product [Cyprideis torosa]